MKSVLPLHMDVPLATHRRLRPQSARTRHASAREIAPLRASATAAWVIGTMPSSTAALWIASASAPGTMSCEYAV
jgi:hypothetical protein